MTRDDSDKAYYLMGKKDALEEAMDCCKGPDALLPDGDRMYWRDGRTAYDLIVIAFRQAEEELDELAKLAETKNKPKP